LVTYEIGPSARQTNGQDSRVDVVVAAAGVA